MMLGLLKMRGKFLMANTLVASVIIESHLTAATELGLTILALDDSFDDSIPAAGGEKKNALRRVSPNIDIDNENDLDDELVFGAPPSTFAGRHLETDLNSLKNNPLKVGGHLFGPGYQQYDMAEIRKFDEGMIDVEAVCHAKCVNEEECTGFHYRVDNRYDGRTNGNCWFMTGDIKHVPGSNGSKYGGNWIKVPTDKAGTCPDISTRTASSDASCVCNSPKSKRLTIEQGGQRSYACALPDYSGTKCASYLDCNYVDSTCACVRADYNGPTSPITCNQYQCIPQKGAANGESCYTDQLCESGHCLYVNGDSNKGTCI